MFDDLRVEVGEVGEGAFPDLAVVAPGLSQQHGGRRVAVRDNVDIHGDLLNIHDNICQYPYGHYMVTILTPKKPRTRVNTREKLLQGEKVRAKPIYRCQRSWYGPGGEATFLTVGERGTRERTELACARA